MEVVIKLLVRINTLTLLIIKKYLRLRPFLPSLIVLFFVFGYGCQKEPLIVFTLSPESGYIYDTITFTNTSQNASSYSWDFGDGSSSTEQNPTHAYATAGTFTITLTATGAGGTSTATKTIGITITIPGAKSESPFSIRYLKD